jgi:hypothetical protein
MLLLLVSALPGLALQSGRPLPADVFTGGGSWHESLYPLIILSVIVYTLGLLYMLRRRLATTIVGLILLALFLLFLAWAYREPALPLVLPPTPDLASEMTPSANAEEAPPAEFVEGEEGEPFRPPSARAVLVASVVVGLLMLTAMAGVGYYLWLQLRPLEPPLAELAREAQTAVDSLRSGGELYDVVIRCYHEMSRVLSESRGISRPEQMTPREFAGYLAAMGLPQEPISGLTRLFEEVRYGTKEAGATEEEWAIASLTAIVEACEVVS